MSEAIMKKRQAAIDESYEAQWDGGKGSHHPDYDPTADGSDVKKASRETEELLMAVIKNDIRLVYKKIEEGANINFVFGKAYGCPEGYTPLMCAALRGRLECAKALLRSGADPNFQNSNGDLVLFWAIDGGVEMTKLMVDYGADLNAKTPKNWTPLSYARAKGKYGLCHEKGIYPEDVLKARFSRGRPSTNYNGQRLNPPSRNTMGLMRTGAPHHGLATADGQLSTPSLRAFRSPRESFNPEADNFMRDRGSYQNEAAHP